MSDLPPDFAALADVLRPAVLHVSRRLRQAGQRHGLSAQDLMILVQVRKHPGIGVSALADAERISRPTMSAHIKRLEAEGLLSRTGDHRDGRRSGLSVTANGEARLEQVRRDRNDWLAPRLAKLSSADRALLAQAAPILQQLADL